MGAVIPGIDPDAAFLHAALLAGELHLRVEHLNAKNLATAAAGLKSLVEAYRNMAPELAAWLEAAIPEGLAVVTLPEHYRKRMRTSNPIEPAVQQELK